MKHSRFSFMTLLVVLVLVTLACGFNVSTANIKNAYMARDDEGAELTTVFGQTDTFYCIVELANAPDDTTVKAVWTAVQVENTEPNTLIDEIETTQGDGIIPISLVPATAWPFGTFKVDLYINGNLKQTLEFVVQ